MYSTSVSLTNATLKKVVLTLVPQIKTSINEDVTKMFLNEVPFTSVFLNKVPEMMNPILVCLRSL